MSATWWDASREVVLETASECRVVRGKRPPTPELELFVHRFLLRVGLVAVLAKRADLGDGIFWERFDTTPVGPYRTDQLFGLLFHSALSCPSEKARRLVSDHVGMVPFVGTGLFQREAFEREFEEGESVVVVPDALFPWLFQRGGLTLAESVVDEKPSSSDLAHWERQMSALSPEAAHEAHFLEPNCGRGERIVALLHAMAARSVPTDGFTRLLDRHLVAVESDPMNVQEARFRLATAAFILQDKLTPLPDLRETVRQGHLPRTSSPEPSTEDAKTEFKAAFEWNSRTRERSQDLKFGFLRTVAAFLNSEGGSVHLGVSDDGETVGIDDELSQIVDRNPQDIFEQKLRESIKNHIEPHPLGRVSVQFDSCQGATVCRVHVEPANGVTYLLRKGTDGRILEEIYVRDGNRTLNLTGRTRDQFVLSKNG